MRTLMFTVAAITLGTGAARAQSGKFPSRRELGVVVGSTVADFRAPTSVGASNRAGPLVGLYYDLHAGGRVSFEPELVLAQKGATLAIDPVANGFDQARYLEAPLLGRVNLTEGRTVRPFVVAGPTVGLRLDCTAGRVLGSTPFAESCDKAGAGLTRGEVSGTVGAGLDFGRFQVGGRYELGLTRVNAAAQAGALKNKLLAFTFGVALHR